MTNGVSTAAYAGSQAATPAAVAVAQSSWDNPYLLGSCAISVTAVLTLCFSLLLVCHRLHHFHYCSLFLVEMAVGSLTTEALMNLLPALIRADSPAKAAGMPPFFPHLAAVTAGVCLLHALDTTSVVFYGRRQSTSHAMEWRNTNHQRPQQQHIETTLATFVGSVVEQEDLTDGEGSVKSTKFSQDSDSSQDITIRQALANPRLCLRHGPYRLCSLISIGSILLSFANGVALGAAFVKSWESGLHLSLSVGTHELAHKVADFAVLTASGFSLQAVLLLNCCYWLSAFIGLFVSVPLSQKSDHVRLWIMTVVTAMFVYVSLVTMSSLVRKNYLPKHTKAFVIGNAGMTTGYLLITLASVLEFFY